LDGAADLSAAVGEGGGGGDPCAMSSVQKRAHICTGVERVALPERWPFPKNPEHKSNVENMEDMVGQARTLAMKRMINKMLTAIPRKRVCTVQTALAKIDETYVSIVKDLLPTKPGSQGEQMNWF
jgi:hypothetical protein